MHFPRVFLTSQRTNRNLHTTRRKILQKAPQNIEKLYPNFNELGYIWLETTCRIRAKIKELSQNFRLLDLNDNRFFGVKWIGIVYKIQIFTILT